MSQLRMTIQRTERSAKPLFHAGLTAYPTTGRFFSNMFKAALRLFVFLFSLSYADTENITTLCGWSLIDESHDTKKSSGGILRATRMHLTKDLYYHTRPLICLGQTSHYIIFKNTIGSHTSHSIFIVHVDDQNAPSVIYESPDWHLDNECCISLESYHEKNGILYFSIRLYEQRNEKSSIIINHSISIGSIPPKG